MRFLLGCLFLMVGSSASHANDLVGQAKVTGLYYLDGFHGVQLSALPKGCKNNTDRWVYDQYMVQSGVWSLMQTFYLKGARVWVAYSVDTFGKCYSIWAASTSKLDITAAQQGKADAAAAARAAGSE